MVKFAESEVEAAALEWLEELGYSPIHGPCIGPDGPMPERGSHDEVLLAGRLQEAVRRLNPHLSDETLQEVVKKVRQTETPSLVEENRRLHDYLVNGVPVEIVGEDGRISGDAVRLIDFADIEANDWVAVNQFTVIENGRTRRPDLVLFVNGLPLAVIELKSPTDGNATLEKAFNQIETYKDDIPSLFRANAVLMTSDGIQARIGSLTAKIDRFMPWRTVDGSAVAPKGVPEIDTAIKGVFEKNRFLAMIRDFTVFMDTGADLVKIIAGYHQFHAVRKAVKRTLDAAASEGDGRIGVIWHTQGSGKSLLMAFYAGQIIGSPEMRNPTVVVVTDRNDLDDQLFTTFSKCRELLRQTPKQAENRQDLKNVLAVDSGGVVFTTMQKFSPNDGDTAFPVLTDRHNVIVIADEAHRSQYGFGAKVATQTGEISYGFAKYLREGLPNASFIGFTGTPIEKEDANTPAVFGDYIDIYDINRSVEDGATVPIYYESRLARIELDENEKPLLDAKIAALTEDEAKAKQDQIKLKWNSLESVVGAEKRLRRIAADLVNHFEDREAGVEGKAMAVCMSRRICVALYEEIVKLRPDWHSDDDATGTVKVVMTGSAADPKEWQRFIGSKARRELLAKRIKNTDDTLKLVIVCDMWLTGFDAPSLHTMYIDKPMRGHGLMQAIARVNRVFRGKHAGLVVDYIGIAQNLKSALGQYTRTDQDHVGIDMAKAIEVMREKYEVVAAMFHGFDFRSGISGSAKERLATLAGAMNWILEMQQRDADRETTNEGKIRIRRRFSDTVLTLVKAFSLAAASDEALRIRDDVAFFTAVRTALEKNVARGDKSRKAHELAIQQIVNRAIVSTEIVDILAAAGLKTPDISILSDEFLAEIQGMEHKNLALEALRKLINSELRSKSRVNLVQTRAFSEKLEEAIARYHSNAITTAGVINELIALARDIRNAYRRGEEDGLNEEEIAFYDALAQNKSAVEVMGNDQLRLIAQELLNNLRNTASVDWHHRESARARMRLQVKRILRKWGYPPDLQDGAVQTVLQQAEALTTNWADNT